MDEGIGKVGVAFNEVKPHDHIFLVLTVKHDMSVE